jgi:hypothetical protein
MLIEDVTNNPTGQVIARLTMSKNLRIDIGACLEGSYYCGIKVYEIPLPPEPGKKPQTKLSLHFAKKRPPMWWSPIHQQYVLAWLSDNQVKLIIAYKNRQQKVKPTGYLGPNA